MTSSFYNHKHFHNFAPYYDIRQSDMEISINLEVPGIAREDIRLELANGILTVSGEKRVDAVVITDPKQKVVISHNKTVVVPSSGGPIKTVVTETDTATTRTVVNDSRVVSDSTVVRDDAPVSHHEHKSKVTKTVTKDTKVVSNPKKTVETTVVKETESKIIHDPNRTAKNYPDVQTTIQDDSSSTSTSFPVVAEKRTVVLKKDPLDKETIVVTGSDSVEIVRTGLAHKSHHHKDYKDKRYEGEEHVHHQKAVAVEEDDQHTLDDNHVYHKDHMDHIHQLHKDKVVDDKDRFKAKEITLVDHDGGLHTRTVAVDRDPLHKEIISKNPVPKEEDDRYILDPKDHKYYYSCDRSFGPFTRHIRVPDDLTPDDIDAHLQNGILNITMPHKHWGRKSDNRNIEVKEGKRF